MNDKESTENFHLKTKEVRISNLERLLLGAIKSAQRFHADILTCILDILPDVEDKSHAALFLITTILLFSFGR